MDIYNHNASVSIISIGDSPNVIDHFPMAAWKQKAITAAILTGVTIISAGAGFGVSAAISSAAQLVGWAIGAGVGAIGGTVDAIIYSTDNQDYSQFMNRVRDGVVIGISAASLGMAIHNVINYKPSEFKSNEFDPTNIKPGEYNPSDFLNPEAYNGAEKFLYDENVQVGDIDNYLYLDDGFKFSEGHG